MKEYTPEYLAHLRKIIEDHADDAARDELADLHPADIAELYQDLDLDEAEYLYKLLDEDAQADVLMELDEDDRAKLLSKMDAEDIAKQIEHLDTDDAVDIIQELDEDERDKILSHIDDVEQAGDIIVSRFCQLTSRSAQSSEPDTFSSTALPLKKSGSGQVPGTVRPCTL